jgi:hypothetical protein
LAPSRYEGDLEVVGAARGGSGRLVLTRYLNAVDHRRRPLSPVASAFLRFLKADPLKPDRR